MSDISTVAAVRYCSNLAGSAWHGSQAGGAFERWRFDALSDDGSEALVIEFTDNYPLSPRYVAGASAHDLRLAPAVSLAYSVDGKIVLRALNEYEGDAFHAGDGVGGRIANSSFNFMTANYGAGFVIKLDLLTSNGRITGGLEWISIETDLLPDPEEDMSSSLTINMAVSRADVSGRLTLTSKNGDALRAAHFRGTGYHEHLRSEGPLTTRFMCQGHAHFSDATAVVAFIEPTVRNAASSRLSTVRNGEMLSQDATLEMSDLKRDRYGMRVPGQMAFATDDGVKLQLRPLRVVDRGFLSTAMTCEAVLHVGDGKPRRTAGLLEFCSPARMRHTTVRWLHDLRIERKG
ncbi:MAG TPA: hypothetical protein VGO43_09205 [Pyrinomonadaceae bacterium]|nr:hypothetical protein [Pyrinomonadaceae bacterium]